MGNVLEVVADHKLPTDSNSDGHVDYYLADVVSYSDYYPFGMLMPNRHGNSGDYRYGFNSMEKDDELKSSEGTSYDFGARMYDPRIGRWLSRDPMENKKPGKSPYKAFKNNPEMFIDPDGNDEYLSFVIKDERTGTTTTLRVTNAISNKMMTDGIKHQVNTGANTYYYENYYYDYKTVVYITINKDGVPKVTNTAPYILKDHGVKGDSFVWYDGEPAGDIYDPWDDPNFDGEGGVQSDGFTWTTSSGGASPTKAKSLHNAEERDVEDLLTVLGKLSGGSLGGKWQDKVSELTGIVQDYIEVSGYKGETMYDTKDQWVLFKTVVSQSSNVTTQQTQIETFKTKDDLLKKYKNAQIVEGSVNTMKVTVQQ